MAQRTYFANIVLLAHIAATIAAGVVAFGAAIGFFDMTDSWPLAVLGGVGIASILGLGWWNLITAASKTRRAGAQAGVVTLGVVLVAIALGTSGWALATAIGGKQALSAYQVRALSEHETALTEAHSRALAQNDLVDTVRQNATATRLLGREEARTGEGPLFRSYERTASNLDTAAADMESKVSGAAAIYEDGRAAVAQANESLGNAEGFRMALADIAMAIRDLNAIDVSDDILSIGMVGLNDKGLPELSGLTQDLRNAAESSETEPVEVPSYVSATRAEATLSERPAGAWIAAAAIDTAPLLMLLMVILLGREPLLREERQARRHVTEDDIREQEARIDGPRLVAGE